jgi:hypothetical protein
VPQSLPDVPGRQVVPEQHPVAQLVESHAGPVHPPEAQRRFAVHTGPAPQWQTPSVPQLSAAQDWQLVQAPPWTPQ